MSDEVTENDPELLLQMHSSPSSVTHWQHTNPSFNL